MENKYVIFKLGVERYGLPIENVERILPSQEVTKIPRSPKMLLGVFELRGQTIPTIDARLRFEMPPSETAKNFVVVFSDSGRCALRVDIVDGIVSFEEQDIDRSPELFKSSDEFLSAIGKCGDELTVLLDPVHLVPTSLKTKLSAAA